MLNFMLFCPFFFYVFYLESKIFKVIEITGIMTIKINFHMHTTGSDGKLTPEQVIQEAIANKVEFMCFTDHFPSPDNLDPYGENYYKEEGYKELLSLKEQYKDKIDISIGVEFDWIEGYSEWYKNEISKRKYDFVMGSIHALFDENKKPSGFWDNEEEIMRFMDKIGGTKRYVKEYYRQLRLMIASDVFDCVGHLDIIKLNNKNDVLFSEEDSWYKQEVKKTLKLLAESKMCLEINTRGILKHGEGKQYPSLWILKETKKLNIPLTIGTDFHRTGENEPFLEKAYNLARQAGYKEIVRFKARKPIKIKI
jgi:histidinol-phosphatase (PHP family)